MNDTLSKIKIGAIVFSFFVLVVALMGISYVRANYYMKDQIRAYVTNNMPSDLSGEERKKKATSLATEFAKKPEQVAITIATISICFLLAGYVAGSKSSSHINAAIAAISGSLLFSPISIRSVTFWMTIIVGLAFALIGSKFAIHKKQRNLAAGS